jgi:hypothetical protein
VFTLAESIQLIDRPVLQVDEPEIDCMGLIKSTLQIMFWFQWELRITRHLLHLISPGIGQHQVKHSKAQ